MWGVVMDNIFMANRTTLGAYDDLAIHPTDNNWIRKSVFEVDHMPEKRREVDLPYFIMYKTEFDRFVINRDGEILISVSDRKLLNDHFGKILRINKEGKVDELFSTDKHILPPVVGENGNIYVAEAYSFSHEQEELHLYALSPNGDLLWSKGFLCSSIYSTPVLDQYGNIYIVTVNIKKNMTFALFCLNALSVLNGEEKWGWSHTGSNICEPKIGKDGSIYYSFLNRVVKITNTGSVEWEKSYNSSFNTIGPLAIHMNGDMSFACDDNIYILNEKGEEIRKIEVDGLSVSSLPLLYGTDKYICSVNGGKLVSVDFYGNVLWEYETKSTQNFSHPIIERNGNIIFCAIDYDIVESTSYISMINEHGTCLWELEIKGMVISIVIGGDNLLHILYSYKIKRLKNKDDNPFGYKLLTLYD